MGQIWEYIKIALMNIRTNKGRSVLTMLGIIIGIASVIMIISIGNGVRSSVNEELENMGGGLIAIYTNENVEGNDVRFTEEDFALIKEKVEHVKGATAQYGYWGATARGRKGADFPTTLNGGNTALQYAIGNEPIVRGRYFSQSECESASMVCVINESSARSLFGTTDVVGMSFEITLWDVSQDVRIVGIRQDTPAGLISAMSGSGYLQVEMPLAAMASGFGLWIGEFSQLYVIAESSEYVTQVAADTITLLENRYNVRGENKIMMESFADYSEVPEKPLHSFRDSTALQNQSHHRTKAHLYNQGNNTVGYIVPEHNRKYAVRKKSPVIIHTDKCCTCGVGGQPEKAVSNIH